MLYWARPLHLLKPACPWACGLQQKTHWGEKPPHCNGRQARTRYNWRNPIYQWRPTQQIKNQYFLKEEKVEAGTDFIFPGSKITAHCDCSHEIKRCLLLSRKTMTNLDSVLQSRDITIPLLTTVRLVKAVVFPVKWSEEVKSLSRVQLFETPWTVARQAPLSMGFSRQEYWSGLP